MIHIVEFDEYCPKCKHRDLEEYKSPCHECLNIPVMENSRKPSFYTEFGHNDESKKSEKNEA